MDKLIFFVEQYKALPKVSLCVIEFSVDVPPGMRIEVNTKRYLCHLQQKEFLEFPVSVIST